MFTFITVPVLTNTGTGARGGAAAARMKRIVITGPVLYYCRVGSGALRRRGGGTLPTLEGATTNNYFNCSLVISLFFVLCSYLF